MVAPKSIRTLMRDRGCRLRPRVLTGYTQEGIMRDRILPFLDRLAAVSRPCIGAISVYRRPPVLIGAARGAAGAC
jgi:hypothetical protein